MSKDNKIEDHKISVRFEGVSENAIDDPTSSFHKLKDEMTKVAGLTRGQAVHIEPSAKKVHLIFNGSNPNAIKPFLEEYATTDRKSLKCEDLGVRPIDSEITTKARTFNITLG